MIDGIPVIDAHLHVAHLATLKLDWSRWTGGFHDEQRRVALHDPDGAPRPEAVAAYVADEGVDLGLLMSEYSPKVTGIQSAEDNLAIVDGAPERFRFIAALNPHYHHPLVDELDRQVALGAVAVKLHPVHGGFEVTEPGLYPVYERCVELGLPLVVHCGTSVFPGATNRFGHPVMVDEVLRDVPGLTVLLAHGGRGWWYDAAGFLALAREQVWIELSGLPPARLPQYFASVGFSRLARKCVFGSDWPGVPSIARNVRTLVELGLDDDVLADVLHGNALRLYRGLQLPDPAREAAAAAT